MRASHQSLAELRMSELERAAATRASRTSRTSQYSRQRRHHQQQQQQHQQQQHQPTTGDESSWETDRERGSSSTGLLRGVPTPVHGGSVHGGSVHGSQSNLRQHGRSRRSTHGSVRSATTMGDPENWTDHDMDIYMAHNTMRNDLVRL